MLDPKEAKKGGFGAFAQRDRERREAEAAATNAATPAPPATAVPLANERTPDGTALPDTPGTT